MHALLVPAPGATEFGQTSIDTLDLAAPAEDVEGIVVLGQASVVYANQDVLLLAQPDYWWWAGVAEQQQTALHLFQIEADETPYVASGNAPGTIKDQFSLDERDGIVRLSTTEQVRAESGWAEPINQVVTLEPQGGLLKVMGKSEPLAPGETLYSTRFLGDIAYVVTFRQMDPLFAVDLGDPAKPTLIGELEIPGFSDYMHPLGESHLLTIGRSVDPATGVDNGLLLQIFDVSAPTDPKQAFTYTFTKEGWSAANSNHKAFTYYEEKSLLAFPFVSYSNYPEVSTLEVLRVSVDTGFEPVGAIDHTAFFEQSCLTYDAASDYAYYQCSYAPEVRRGVFIGDAVYSISYGGVLVHDIGDLVTPLAQVTLPPPQISSNGDETWTYTDTTFISASTRSVAVTSTGLVTDPSMTSTSSGVISSVATTSTSTDSMTSDTATSTSTGTATSDTVTSTETETATAS